MAKRIVSYRDVKRIANGTTTIVYGKTRIKAKGHVAEDLIKTIKVLGNIYGGGEGIAQGVAKLHPEDTYDAKSGQIVASKKAEIKGLVASRKILVEALANLDVVAEDLRAEIASIDARHESLRNDKH